MNVDFTKIDNIIVEGIDMNDYPKFCDAYIGSADIAGVPATDAELDAINENYNFLYDAIQEALY